jgi:hypothetical protein
MVMVIVADDVRSTGLWTIGGGDSSCLRGDSPASITSSAPSQTSGSSATASVSGIGGGGGRPGRYVLDFHGKPF